MTLEERMEAMKVSDFEHHLPHRSLSFRLHGQSININLFAGNVGKEFCKTHWRKYGEFKKKGRIVYYMRLDHAGKSSVPISSDSYVLYGLPEHRRELVEKLEKFHGTDKLSEILSLTKDLRVVKPFQW